MAGKPKGLPKSGGRKAGTPNKATAEFRQTITELLDKNRANVELWLAQVAEGDSSKEIKADPAKALDLIAKLAEYAAPKLNRSEISGPDGGPVETVSKIELVALNAKSTD